MRLTKAPARAGTLWFKQSLWLFKRNIFGFLTVSIAYTFAMIALSLLPVISDVLPLLLLPGIAVGFMSAGREAEGGRPFFPQVLLAGFRAHGSQIARKLLLMGVVYGVAVALTFVLSAVADGGQLMQRVLLGGGFDEQSLASPDIALAMMVSMLAYVPIAMVFCFSPVLVAWHGIPIRQAFFASWVACWRNRAALLVNSLMWMAVMLVVMFGISPLLIAAGGVSLILPLLGLFWMIGGALLCCQLYVAYRGCFETDEPPLAITAKPTGKPGG